MRNRRRPRLQTRGSRERQVWDLGDTFADHGVGQVVAIVERVVPDAGDATWDGCFAKETLHNRCSLIYPHPIGTVVKQEERLMKHRLVYCIISATMAIGVVGVMAAEAANDGSAGASPVEYVGTFHPKKSSCAACHARATVSRAGSEYTLRVEVDYSGRKKNKKGPDSRVFVMEGTSGETGLVFENKRYKATITGDQLIGERLGTNAEVPAVLKMKLAAPEK